MSTIYTPGKSIPIPLNFPVSWRDASQATQLWQLERIHFAEPVLPLVASVWQAQISPAFNQVAEQYQLPVRVDFLPLNSYLYTSYRTVGLPPNWVLQGMRKLGRLGKIVQDRAVARIAERYLAQLEPVISNLAARWAYDWQPELQRYLAWWENLPLATAPLPTLMTYLADSLVRIQQVWAIHFQLVTPTFMALHQFEELCGSLFPEAEPLAPWQLIQGSDNSFLQAERALWQLSRQICTMPAVRQIIREQPQEQVWLQLEACPEGQIVLAELRAFLARNGRRGHNNDGLSDPSWQEDPTPVLQNLKALLEQPDHDLRAAQQAQAAEREMRIQQAQMRLQNHPLRQRFDLWLAAAQTAVYLHEEHNFWIDQQAMFELRRLFLAIGRQLANAGVIAQASDIFYLTVPELEATAVDLPNLAQHKLVQTRQAEISHFSAITPPPALGTMPLMQPDNDPLFNAFNKVLGSMVPAATANETAKANQWQGQAAATGLASGPARIIHTLAEAERLQPGDILVTVATLPPWTPLLGRATAVVTETGGVLSHAATIAREYGLPAVVGLPNATHLIQDGQWIEVDGSKGIVRALA